MDLQDVVNEIRENRKITSRMEKELIEHKYQHEAIDNRLKGVEKRTENLEGRTEKNEKDISGLKYINVKLVAILSAAMWLIVSVLKWLGALALKAIGFGVHP